MNPVTDLKHKSVLGSPPVAIMAGMNTNKGTPMTKGTLEAVLETNGAKAGFKIYVVVLGVLVSALLTLSTVELGQMNARSLQAVNTNITQDQTFIKQQAQMDYTGHRVDALERSSDATIQTLQAMTAQVTHLNDRMEQQDAAINKVKASQ